MAKELKISLTEEQIKRFKSRIKIDEESGCHIYIGRKRKDGYGSVDVYDFSLLAHRVAWIIAYGKIPNNLCILHKCDNRICINPNHLFLGTQRDNINDMINKGRRGTTRGEINGRAKLTEQQVLEILNIVKQRGNYKGLSIELMKIYTIGKSQMWNIINGKEWKYLTI